MSPEPLAKPVGRGIPVWVLVVTLLAVAAVAGTGAWYLASRPSDDDTSTGEATVEPGADSAAPETQGAAAETPADTTPAQPKPSFVRYAYVRAVTGSPGSWEASLDLFDIFTGAEAESYAASHSMTVRGNGILYVNESDVPESVPLSDAAVITYNTGGVEGLTTHPATIEQLRDWAAGSETAMPDAFRDQWKVTVVEGVVTRVEMIAVAD